MRRYANAGSFAATFSESPCQLGLPSLYSGHWDPVFEACAETETTACMHIGSSSTVASPSPDAPLATMSALTFQYGTYSLIDVILSGTLARFPAFTFMYSEANVGWIPYILGRMDYAWREYAAGYPGIDFPKPPSESLKDRVSGCIFGDEAGLAMRDHVGAKQICYETDFPHNARLFPNSIDTAARLIKQAGLTEEETYDFLPGNAIRALGMQRFGVTP